MKKNKYGYFYGHCRLNATKNIMICITKDRINYVYFSKNKYETITKANYAANVYMRNDYKKQTAITSHYVNSP
jgi:hypothetical protein